MATTIKKPFKKFNGMDWDTVYFDASEDQIKTGWTQLLTTTGYRKLPGGLIIQWGIVGGTMNGTSLVLAKTLALAFPTELFSVVSSIRNIDNDTAGQTELFSCNPTIMNLSTINVRFRRNDGSTYSGPITGEYIALGY